jgi:hypothetical protein
MSGMSELQYASHADCRPVAWRDPEGDVTGRLVLLADGSIDAAASARAARR